MQGRVCTHCQLPARPYHRQPHVRQRNLQGAASRPRVVRAAKEESSDDFDKRLGNLQGKGFGKVTPKQALKQSQERAKRGESGSNGNSQEPKYDFSDEKLHFESTPHRGDLAVNIAFGATLLWLPLTIAAVGRAAFVKFRFTDRRLSVITAAPWKNEQLDAAYQEVKDVVIVPRGLGFWGDMVVTLKNDDKIELRSLPQHKELRDYILRRRDELKTGALAA